MKACFLLLGFLSSFWLVQGALVEPTPLVLDYHGGQLLTGKGSLLVYLIWYGDFTPAQKSIVTGFINSLAVSSSSSPPSPSGFWRVIASYVDASGSHVRSSVRLGGQISLPSSSYGKKLTRAQLAEIIAAVLASQALPAHPKSVYVIITSADVAVERFCMNSCATHSYINGSLATRGPRLPYAWVGNSATQCPGYCAWPFAKAAYGPPDAMALKPPSGDVGMDGVVINLALMLAGSATNPFGRGYYQGDASAPLEAGTACQGIFGEGSYPGYPGELLLDKASGASYNAEGVGGAKYLLPALWNPATKACSTSF